MTNQDDTTGCFVATVAMIAAFAAIACVVSWIIGCA